MAEERITLEEAIVMASRLDPAERMKLRQALDQMAGAPTGEDREATFKRVLFERGFISKFPSRPEVADAGKRHPVPVQGKPVSETIIEDRR